MPEKSAIRALLDHIAGTPSLQEVYDTAIACLRSTLGVERAAVLVFDRENRMRFVGWVGLSAQYREAVDGHSPWTAEDTDAQSLLIGDVLSEPSLQHHLPAFAGEGIRGVAFVPLRFGPKLLGKFMLYYSAPHEFTPDEVKIAEIVAGHVAFALEHRRIAGELEARVASERELRREAEQEVRLRQESERRLRLALAAGQMGAWAWDIATGRVHWSEELEAIHGLEQGAFPGSIEASQQDVHPEDKARVAAAIKRSVRHPAAEYEIEYRILPPDGGLRWVAARGKVLFDGDGSPTRMVGICSDVTERKRVDEAEAFLGQASRMLATTLDPDALLRSLAKIVVPRLADWCLIQTLGDDNGLVPIELIHSDGARTEVGWQILRRWRLRAESIAAAASVIESGESRLIPRIGPELLSTWADDGEHLGCLEALGLRSGITVPLRVRGRLLGTLTLLSAESQRTYTAADLRFAEEIGSWAALAIDNAELFREAKDARGAAEQARQQLQMLAEASADLASSLDPDTVLIRLADRIVEKMADYCVTYAFDGRVIRRLGLAHRDHAQAPLVAKLEAAGSPTVHDPAGAGLVIRSGEPILAEEITSQLLEKGAQNAEHLQVLRALEPRSAIVVPMKARGRIVGAIALATTAMSGRNYGPADLQLATELASRAALLVDNARLYAEAKAAIRARDDMIAVVSHDLRNPLQSISTAAALLRADPSEERRARNLRSITIATGQMDRLLHDLLDISRMDAGEFSVTLDRVEVDALIDEARSLFQPLAEERGVRFEVLMPAHPACVRADRARILQVLSNLLSNALKFVPAGGEVVVTVESRPEAVEFSVADNGIGIKEEHLAKVFERFWRVDRRRQHGAGLGLAVAKGIVTAHGGRIGVESREGEGARFYFHVHKHDPSPNSAAADDAALAAAE